MTKVPSVYETERTSPGPPYRPNRLPGRPVPQATRRGRVSARTVGFPPIPASRSDLRMMPVSNGLKYFYRF
jgi:hypothetical protein